MMSRRCLDGAAGARGQQMSSPSRRVRRSRGDSSSDDDDDDQDAVNCSRPVTSASPAVNVGLRRPNASRRTHFLHCFLDFCS